MPINTTIEPHTANAAVAEISWDDPKIANAFSLIAFIAVTPFSLSASDFDRPVMKEIWELLQLAPVTAITEKRNKFAVGQ